MPAELSAERSFTLVFDGEVDALLLNKDVGMVPAYMHRLYGIPAEIICYGDPGEGGAVRDFNGVRITRVKRNLLNRIPVLRSFLSPLTLTLAFRARSIGCLMQMHPSSSKYVNRALYSLLNPSGKTYLKLDVDLEVMKKLSSPRFPARGIRNALLSSFTLISAETSAVYAEMKKLLPSARIMQLPNGFDTLLGGMVQAPSFAEKEDLVLVSGRIGCRQKNHEMLLDALLKTDMNGWKLIAAGPIEPGFEKVIEDFYRQAPEKKHSVIFMGPARDRAELYGLYKRSKVLCMTSLYEGFPLVMAEAAYFGNYIISTPVGAERDITSGGKFGAVVPMNDRGALSRELSEVFSGKKDLKACYDGIISNSRKNFTWEKIIANLHTALYGRQDR
jgi:glycosyltransferase involved in cell wall biosynthesis